MHASSLRGKKLINALFDHQRDAGIAWIPFAGIHAGKLIDASARDVLTDGETLFRALTEVHRIYRPDGQPVMFDLQLEAEALGCDLLWADDAPPSVASHPFEDFTTETQFPDSRANIPFGPTAARFPLVLDVMRRMKSAVGAETALYGLFCGPFTLASHLRGTNLFMDMMDDPTIVHRLLDYTFRIAEEVAGWYIDAGMDVVASVDPLVSQISPDHFEEFLSQPYLKLFEAIRMRRVHSSFFVCGNATRNIEVMCRTRPDSISIDENIDLAEAKQITDRYDIVMGGNIPLTTVMLFGTQQDNMKCVVDLIDAAGEHGNLIIAPGCDMPYAVPIENTIAVEQAVHETNQVREMIRNYEHVDESIEVELPDYARLPRPLVEVFTLDSATCAACSYMLASAMDAKKKYDTGIDVVEYKYNSRENIARMKRIGVANLPSIYINGKLIFSSIIPNREELNREINRAMIETGHPRIR
ncbi:MAG TPA: uroporphyrinogen decarboxylase family protein [Spirochaetia bacterium]|nr:uroporphyrinogen decarboxylase family protein [Spirochaetia bacterium]